MRVTLSVLTVSLICSSWLPKALSQETEAAEILKHAQIKRGICCVLGAGDGSLPIALATASEMLIYVRDPDPEKIHNLQHLAEQAGYPIQQLLAETGSFDRLPFAENTVDLLIALKDNDASGSEEKFDPAEPLRVLRPEGVAMVRGVSLIGDVESKTWQSKDGNGAPWTVLTKPVPEGLDEWSHWEKAPDNNPVSSDLHIKAPYMTQFMAKPWYIGMPAITTAAGGRTFLAMGHIAHHEREWEMLNRLIARNGYNGTILWERKLPEDYLVHRSAFVATKDTFHMINGDHVLLLDSRTGKEKGEIRIPGFAGDWKWIAIVDDVLYALAGEPGDGVEPIRGNRAMGGWSWSDLSKGLRNGQDGRHIPHGFGDVIAAYDLKNEKLLWKHQEESLIDSRGLAIRDNQFFLYCPDKYFRCLDRVTGEISWTNGEEITMGLIEEPGKGLSSTPGWRTQSMVIATPDALVVQGQTRMNVLGVSTKDGSMLWQKKKVTNNPNAIYVDGKVILGVGERGNHIVIDPKNGTVEEQLNFFKRACTRLTASTDSFFVRGEGMTRYDRATKEVQIDGAVRPACNDGVIPAHGLIYLGPWACDCNLSLIGNVARCSAGDFRFDHEATTADRLYTAPDSEKVEPFEIADTDWATYRGNLQRSGFSPVAIKGGGNCLLWQFEPDRENVPTDAVAAGGLIFSGSQDGSVRAINGATGEAKWTFQSNGPIKYPPTIANDRAYFGSSDGHAYCLEAATGRLLWKFRAAPIERHIMIYDSLSSTWPVNTGVLVHDDIAYFGAGIVDHDGTYVYAVDATTGEIIWQNNESGHLNPKLRKGVSAQGNLTILNDSLVMAGGNVISPARFDLKTGQCLETPREQGQPQNNGGKFVGVFGGKRLIAGGRILYSSPRNVSTKGTFDVWSADRQSLTLNYGGIPPAWSDDTLAIANFKYGKITVFDHETLSAKIQKGFDEPATGGNRFTRNLVTALTARNEERWQSNLGDSNQFETLSLALAPNAIVTVARYQDLRRATPQFFLTALRPDTGVQMFQIDLPAEPLPGGLIIDREGRILVSLIDGGLACFGS